MILIADGGSTKCDWLGHTPDTGRKVFSFQTKGLNPSYLPQEEIKTELTRHQELKIVAEKVEELYFFGSGCGNPLYQEIMTGILKSFFKGARTIKVLGDIEGAVFACTSDPGVVAILGTGSNICHFDGKKIDTRIPSLGYTLMDQGSGNHVGRELLKAYYFRKLPSEMNEQIENEFDLNVDLVKQNLYAGAGPSSYLASFAKFVIQNDDQESMRSILDRCLREFFELSVGQFAAELESIPLHFVGSIAHFTRDHIRRICQDSDINLGEIVKRPIEQMFHNIESIRKYNHQ